jgi:hypothetical protein
MIIPGLAYRLPGKSVTALLGGAFGSILSTYSMSASQGVRYRCLPPYISVMVGHERGVTIVDLLSSNGMTPLLRFVVLLRAVTSLCSTWLINRIDSFRICRDAAQTKMRCRQITRMTKFMMCEEGSSRLR